MSLGKGRVLVTGGAGFIGSNLVDRLAGSGRRVRVLDALARPGVERNLAWLKERHGERIEAMIVDVRDREAVEAACAGVEGVFHLAAQVAVTTSLADPGADFDINVAGTFNLLEALRRQGRATPLIFASTNKVYGDLADVPLELTAEGYRPSRGSGAEAGVPESRPLDFHTPYGCSKGAADQYVLDYGRSFGLPTCVFRMSCIYGPRQMGTEDQGWVAHFLIRALRDEPLTVFGDGHQVRDVLYVGDCVDAYLRAFDRIRSVTGRAFNLGGGPSNAISLRTLLAYLEQLLGRRLRVAFEDWRPGDQKFFVADASQAARALELGDPTPWRRGLTELLGWLSRDSGLVPSAREAAA